MALPEQRQTTGQSYQDNTDRLPAMSNNGRTRRRTMLRAAAAAVGILAADTVVSPSSAYALPPGVVECTTLNDFTNEYNCPAPYEGVRATVWHIGTDGAKGDPDHIDLDYPGAPWEASVPMLHGKSAESDGETVIILNSDIGKLEMHVLQPERGSGTTVFVGACCFWISDADNPYRK